ncbi:hypothetical protein [Xylophilus ampelinus]|uniref:PXPV repeat-containing protein n=1 Tax=Xylophilus ampelinus TaxID=54067 RepID=A0A318SP01_9BURK|nr:hypothetical protein [Xylophilus ampelinus]MCS4509772.1 hypothetical protein [Xylophilus ampelinus]PYE78700.1 hypothetical protein DFQ15_10559 [Xylophilus ampelinus]
MNRTFLSRTVLACGIAAALTGCVVAPPADGYGYPYGGVGYTETVVVPPPAYGYGGYGAYGGDYAYPRGYYSDPGYYYPRPGYGGGRPYDRGQPPRAGEYRPAPPAMAPPVGRRPDAADVPRFNQPPGRPAPPARAIPPTDGRRPDAADVPFNR